MTEKKLKPVAKKATSSKAGTGKNSAAPDKSGSIKKAAPAPEKKITTANKPAAKKPASKKATIKPDKPKTPAASKKTSSDTVKRSPARKSPEKRTAPPKAKPARVNKPAMPTPEERYRMIETAAYFIAERHGFQGHADEHWAAAEREVAARLGG